MSRSLENTPQSATELLGSLKIQLSQAPWKQQRSVLSQLLDFGEPGYQVVMDFLIEEKQQATATIISGRALQLLQPVENAQIQTLLKQHFPKGLLRLPDACQVDYSDIQIALMKEAFETADRLTLQKMCELAGETAVQRKWLYFTEVNCFPAIDLQTLDQLWQVYSEGKFGFSQQRDIWLRVGKNWEQFWPKIAWKKGNIWTRYPNEFIWSLDAPIGHLPLTNQLRGVRVMNALMNHPAWGAASDARETPVGF